MRLMEKKLGKYAVLKGYLHEYDSETPNIKEYPTILILPGGGFRTCSSREGEPVAMAYYAEGYQAFVLKYTVVTDNPNVVIEDSMNDVCEAISFIRTESTSLLCKEGKLALIGFSGGGHLAAAVSTHCEQKPDALLLGYPGIVHSNLRALDCPDIPERVDINTPTTFLFGMHGDSVTPPIHMLTFACSLEKAGVPFELHMFRGKGHGLSLGTSLTCAGFTSDINVSYAQWLPMSVRWLRDVFGDFKLYGYNDGRNGRFHIDRTVEKLFSDESSIKVCMNYMPVLEKFAYGDTAAEMTPRKINSFMTVLSEEKLEQFDSELLSITSPTLPHTDM